MKRIIELPSGKLEYADEGQGTVLLFLHGGHSNANDGFWHKGFDQSRYRLITPSRPGYGRSPLSVNTTAADTARLIVELLDTLKIDQVTVVGISAGAPTALELAARRPRRVEKLLLISAVTTGWFSQAESKYRLARRVFRPGLEAIGWAALRGALNVAPRTVAERMFGAFSTVIPAEFRESDVLELRDMLMPLSSGTGFLNDLSQPAPESHIFGRIDCPVLIQHSLNDALVPLSNAEYAASLLPKAIAKYYDNFWGHLLWLGTESEGPIADARAFIAGKNDSVRVNAGERLLAF